ncbi:hypothetical protein N7931_05555 [Catenovulum sp. 2E275]|nr:hypothetical protein [Catenovulum sp. 2E275]MCU4675094.1 hypothetical protein [Catenovulum sp. 2E275]
MVYLSTLLHQAVYKTLCIELKDVEQAAQIANIETEKVMAAMPLSLA